MYMYMYMYSCDVHVYDCVLTVVQPTVQHSFYDLITLQLYTHMKLNNYTADKNNLIIINAPLLRVPTECVSRVSLT